MSPEAAVCGEERPAGAVPWNWNASIPVPRTGGNGGAGWCRPVPWCWAYWGGACPGCCRDSVAGCTGVVGVRDAGALAFYKYIN